MRQELRDLLKFSVSALIEEGVISVDVPADVYIERTRQRDHGDFACNIAMILAKSARMKPRDLASLLLSRLPQNTLIDSIQVTHRESAGTLRTGILTAGRRRLKCCGL